MPLNTEEIMSILSQLSEHRNLRVTVSKSLMAGLIIGGGAAVCGILMGPVGLGVGGSLASIIAACKTSGQFKSVASVIAQDMTPYQQQQLASSCQRIIQDFQIEDVAVLLPLILNTPSMQQALINQIVTFVSSEMRLKIVD